MSMVGIYLIYIRYWLIWMKTISSKPSLTGEEFELDELLATNKSLAQ